MEGLREFIDKLQCGAVRTEDGTTIVSSAAAFQLGKELRRILERSGWIKTSEKRPGPRREVLGLWRSTTGWSHNLGCFLEDPRYFSTGDERGQPRAPDYWMPLPEPPEGE